MTDGAIAAGTGEAHVSATGRADTDGTSDAYRRAVGTRLRAIRKQKELSLHDVERLSGQEFKASVLGAYERGERAISVPRLQRLAMWYQVPVDQLLPPIGSRGFNADRDTLPVTDLPAGHDRRGEHDKPVTINLVRLGELSDPQTELLTRFIESIQLERQDFNGRMLTIRRDDLRAVACILGTTVPGAVVRLQQLGLCV